MKRLIILLALLTAAMGAMAQEADRNMLEIHYRASARTYADDTLHREDVHALFIGERTSKYLSLNTLRRNQALDSLKYRGKMSVDELSDVMNSGKMPKAGSTYIVMKGWPQEGQAVYINHVLRTKYAVSDTLHPFDWHLLEGDTAVAGYQCQKAQCTWRGRTWTVWYAPELPYDNGPWKLGGLPGLVLHAEDAAGDFSFSAQEIIKGRGEPILPEKKLSYCTMREYQSVKTKMESDPAGFISQMTGGRITLGGTLPDGTESVIPSHQPLFMESIEKK